MIYLFCGLIILVGSVAIYLLLPPKPKDLDEHTDCDRTGQMGPFEDDDCH